MAHKKDASDKVSLHAEKVSYLLFERKIKKEMEKSETQKKQGVRRYGSPLLRSMFQLF